MIKVLLVEDDVRLADALAGALEAHGYEVDQARTAGGALAAPPADIVLLDLGLPDMDGIELCQRIRERQDFGDTAIIMVTARRQQRERILGLRSGADDYVVKPLVIEELCARMEAVLRRTTRRVDTVLRTGPVEADLATRSVLCEGRPVELTRKEFDLLAALLEDPGAVVRRADLMEQVWDMNWFGSTKTLDVHVASLRRKLGDPGWIETIRGVGFRAVEPS